MYHDSQVHHFLNGYQDNLFLLFTDIQPMNTREDAAGYLGAGCRPVVRLGASSRLIALGIRDLACPRRLGLVDDIGDLAQVTVVVHQAEDKLAQGIDG